jgi:hypothetical protein
MEFKILRYREVYLQLEEIRKERKDAVSELVRESVHYWLNVLRSYSTVDRG